MKTLQTFLKESHLIASAPSLESMKKALKEFWFGGEYTFTKVSDKPEIYHIIKDKKLMAGCHVVKQGNRFRFERL